MNDAALHTSAAAKVGSEIMEPDKAIPRDLLNEMEAIPAGFPYVRSESGNNASPFAPEAIAALRREIAGRSDSWRQTELEALPAHANLLGDEVAAANPGTFVVVKVSMRNMQFSPRTLNIKKGTVVEWKNDDLVPHTVTSASFDSGTLGRGQSWRHTFTNPGQVPYACTFHPTMTGVVVVK
jgi:plastocyanin